MSNTKNMSIWDQVKKTDPKYTKESRFGRKVTSISPQYQIQEATRVFGPYGKGWGFSSCELDMSHLDTISLVLVKAVFFYVIDGERHEFSINNSWPIKVIKKKGQEPSPDEDFAKKAETNTMSKALSRLGFSADIFMGQFDDHEYVAMVNNEIALDNAEDKIEEARKQQDEYEEKCAKELKFIKSSASLNELQKLFTDFVRRANLHQDKNQILALTKAKDARKSEL
ncbi:MAG: hypothetical protein JKY50_00630 [Oleispira sp.]|nr:hypothetical protein [Oleispira sp.]